MVLQRTNENCFKNKNADSLQNSAFFMGCANSLMMAVYIFRFSRF
jgi:hypothetical protein